MTNSGVLKADPLFVGLTRPPMIFGASFSFVIFNALGCMIYFIESSDLRAFLLLPFLHMIAYIICFKEPLFLELFLVRSQKCSICKNKTFYGANSYDLY